MRVNKRKFVSIVAAADIQTECFVGHFQGALATFKCSNHSAGRIQVCCYANAESAKTSGECETQTRSIANAKTIRL
jgi:hypothetical protein